MARSLNKAVLIGNLTRDPELRFTPQGSAVCTFGLATNRQWTTESGEKKEDVEFHRIVAWNKLAEICAQLLKKGRKVYVEGRLQTRSWTGQDGNQRSTTEVVISDMIVLDSRQSSVEDFDVPESVMGDSSEDVLPPEIEEKKEGKPTKKVKEKKEVAQESEKEEDLADDDIPF